ncbi:MAG: DUF695 domain-containing protein [Rhodanobacteraceae bacterium]|nr:DUF695 domain-containing protein [Rhodanobacteraceae bacterium]
MARKLIADSWIAVRAQFEDDDLDTVFRFRTQMPTKTVRLRHPTMMIIKWPYQAKKDGMPRQADMKRMSAFEDALEIAIEVPALGIQAACLTGNGRRTWRYFVAEPKTFLTAVNPLLKAHGPGPHIFRRIEDYEWEGLSELMPLLECAHDGG